MTNKESAIAFLNLAGMGDVQAAYDKYIAPEFIHHNPYFPGDRDSLLKAMQEAGRTSPNKSIEVMHCYEDGPTVITHSLVRKEKVDIAVVHIFKFENQKVIELWDLGQAIDPDSPNQLGMF